MNVVGQQRRASCFILTLSVISISGVHASTLKLPKSSVKTKISNLHVPKHGGGP